MSNIVKGSIGTNKMTIFLVILNTALVITLAILSYRNGYKAGVIEGCLIGMYRGTAQAGQAAKYFPHAQKIIDKFDTDMAWKLSQEE